MGSTVPLVRRRRRDDGGEAPGRRRTRSARHAWAPRRDGAVPGAGGGERRHLPLPTIRRRLAGVGALGTRRGLELDTHRPGEGPGAHPTRPPTGRARRERDAEQEDEFALAIQIAAVRFAARTAVSRLVYDIDHCRTSMRLPCRPLGGWRRWLGFAHPHVSGGQRARGNRYRRHGLHPPGRRSPGWAGGLVRDRGRRSRAHLCPRPRRNTRRRADNVRVPEDVGPRVDGESGGLVSSQVCHPSRAACSRAGRSASPNAPAILRCPPPLGGRPRPTMRRDQSARRAAPPAPQRRGSRRSAPRTGR